MVWSPVRTLYRRQWVPRSLPETFEFFERPENLPRITPPRLGFRILTPSPIRMTQGLTIDYTVRVLGIRSHWRSLIREYDPPNSFHDVQVIGPYRLWDHRHRFWREDGGTVIEDFVVYALPLGLLGLLLHRLTVRRQLDAIFDFRQAQIAGLLTEAADAIPLTEVRVSARCARTPRCTSGSGMSRRPWSSAWKPMDNPFVESFNGRRDEKRPYLRDPAGREPPALMTSPPSKGVVDRRRATMSKLGVKRLGLTIWGFEVGTRAAVDMAIEAERHGFDSVFLVEGVFSNDALTTVAAIAGCTSRIGIGTGIANIYLRHPVMLGIAAAAIDEISGGRLVLGIGPNNEAMISRAGLSWRDPRQALRDTTDTVRAVLTGTGLPGLRPPRPASRAVPIHWAAMALETCEAAGRHADGLMLYLCTRDRYRRAVERMRQGAITAGRSSDDVSVSLLIPTFIHDDLATARRAAREFLVHYANLPHYAKVFTASGFGTEMEAVRKAAGNQDRAAAMAALSDRLLDSVLLAGPASRCRDGLAAFREAGVEWALLGPQRVGDQGLAEQAHVLVRELEPR